MMGIKERIAKVFDPPQASVLNELVDLHNEPAKASDLSELKPIDEDMAQAEQRTEVALEQLSGQVGGVSETMGGDIEDIAYIVLGRVLQREFGWEVGVLERQWQTWGKEPEEVHILGQARDPSRPDQVIYIVGEAKYSLIARVVDRFIAQMERARDHLEGEIFPVCFCYRARPEVQQKVKDAGIRLVFSYGKIV